MAAAVLTITNVYDAVAEAAGLNLTTLTGGDAGGSGNSVVTRGGYQGADWRQGLGAGIKYACGETIKPFSFADSGTAPSQANQTYVALTSTDADSADFNGTNGGHALSADTSAKRVVLATSPDAGSINSGFKVPSLVCDQRLHSFFGLMRVFGGTYVAKATMANGEQSAATFSVTNNNFLAGTPLWFRVDYRSVAPTTIEVEVRRTATSESLGHGNQGDWIDVSCFYISVPVAAPIPRGSRNLSAYFAQASR